jgi:solute carrier family 25 protein 38
MKAFLAGSFSGTCSTVLFQPLDLVKTRIQNHQLNHNAISNNEALNKKPGMFQIVRQVLATERLPGLWRGITPSITRTVPGVGLYFGSLHWLKSGFGDEKPSAIQCVGLGMTARSLAATVMIPITVIKTRFESGQFNYTRMSSALMQIYKHEGIRGLTCGLLPTIVRDAPYSGLYLMFYTQLKQNFVPKARNILGLSTEFEDGKKVIQAATHFSCGMMAGFLASLVTHPADVVKTRMQIQPDVYRSIVHASRKILADAGPRGFLIGFAPRMLRRALMSAFAWTIYEEIMKKFGLK